jgi:hypothetical protein
MTHQEFVLPNSGNGKVDSGVDHPQTGCHPSLDETIELNGAKPYFPDV